jgi:hypothetical protein
MTQGRLRGAEAAFRGLILSAGQVIDSPRMLLVGYGLTLMVTSAVAIEVQELSQRRSGE